MRAPPEKTTCCRSATSRSLRPGPEGMKDKLIERDKYERLLDEYYGAHALGQQRGAYTRDVELGLGPQYLEERAEGRPPRII